MTWVRLDDQHDQHRKVAKLSDLAYRIWVSGIAWCHRQRRAGTVPFGDEVLIVPGRKPREVANAVAQLVTVELWHKGEDCYEYHDWLHYQAPVAATASERGKAGAAKRWSHSQEQIATIAKPVSHDSQALANDAPIPIPIPKPDPDPPVGPPSAGPTLRLVEPGTREPKPKSKRAQVTTIPADWFPTDAVLAEIAATHSADPDDIRYQAEEFRKYWLSGGGAGEKKSQWLRTFRNRIHQLVQDGRRISRPKTASTGSSSAITAVSSQPEPKTIDQVLEEQAAKDRADRTAEAARKAGAK